MKEQANGTTYNVEEDLTNWARIKMDNWDAAQRDAIWREFTRRDREFHGERCRARRLANSSTKADH